MKQLINTVVTDMLTALYQPFLFAVALSAIFMFIYMYAKCPAEAGRGYKAALVAWLRQFKNSRFFRRLFVLVFYTSLVLFRTFFNRNLWLNPLSDVCGGWKMWTYNANGVRVYMTDSIENIIMLFPFIILLMWTAKEKLLKNVTFYGIVAMSLKVSFIFSLSIELFQLFFRVGTFQLADLFYNTLGGVIGGIVYGIIWRIKSGRNSEYTK